MKRSSIFLSLSIIFLSNFLFSNIAHSYNASTVPPIAPIAVTVEVIHNKKIVGIGYCNIRIKSNDSKDRIEIIEFLTKIGADGKTIDHLSPESFIINIDDIQIQKPGVYEVKGTEFEGDHFKGTIDFTEATGHPSASGSEYKIHFEDDQKNIIQNISEEGQTIQKEYIAKVY